MASPWASLFIPLVKGLDLSKESMLGGDNLVLATNVDYQVDGAIRGRPGRLNDEHFSVRSPSSRFSLTPAYTSSDLDSTGFTSCGLLRVRDSMGELPALATQGRLFIKGTDEEVDWTDRGPFGCMRVDRVLNYPSAFVITDPATSRETLTPHFSRVRVGGGSPATSIWALMGRSDDYLQLEVSTAAGSYSYPGTGSRCGSTSAAVVVGNANQLNFIYRNDGDVALTLVQLAADARNPADTGDAPVICPRSDGGGFYVAYRTTTANVVKVLRISAVGVVSHTYTSGAIAGMHGIWVDQTAGTVSLAVTHATGLTIRLLAAADLTSAGADINDVSVIQGFDVVVGNETASQAWWAYRTGTDYDLKVGTAAIASGATTVTVQKTFPGLHAYTNASLRWGIVHQPVRLNGRTYLTLTCAGGAGYAGTWLTLDLTNWFTVASTSTGPFDSATIVARGPTQMTYVHSQPGAAVADDESAEYFGFPTLDWMRVDRDRENTLTGIQAMNGWNRVSFSKPRSASIGETTVFSGSVPHMVARGDCVELGYPFLAGEPGLEVEAVAGGSIPAGQYSVIACWAWTDEAGQVHRSAGSPARTVTTTAGLPTIRAHVTNCWLTEKTQRLSIEVYITDISPSTEYKLQSITTVFDAAEPATAIDHTTLDDASEIFYGVGGVLENYHVPGDGGVTSVGRRLWMAGSNQVYASKLWTPGKGPEFNDDAVEDQPSLYVNLPAGAGRVVALETLDDKVVVFCERGVFAIQDGGPSNTGTGADFSTPIRLADLRIAGPRSSCATDSGVVFCTTLDEQDPSKGGPWLLDRQLTLTDRQFLGRSVVAYLDSAWVPEVAFLPERQQVFMTTDRIDEDNARGVLMFDMRVGKWSAWDISDRAGELHHVAAVSGSLWVACASGVGSYSDGPGYDSFRIAGDTDTFAYSMSLATSHLAANGSDGLGWSRVRSVSVLEAEGSGAHSLTMSAALDKTRSYTSGTYALTASVPDTTWPSTRQSPEWRLPSQKCSTLQVQLSATPAVARWAAIRLEVAPLPPRAPARSRS
jgi:hypothetical protein